MPPCRRHGRRAHRPVELSNSRVRAGVASQAIDPQQQRFSSPSVPAMPRMSLTRRYELQAVHNQTVDRAFPLRGAGSNRVVVLPAVGPSSAESSRRTDVDACSTLNLCTTSEVLNTIVVCTLFIGS